MVRFLMLLLVLAGPLVCTPGCGEPEAETGVGPSMRSSSGLQAAQALVKAGRYLRARAALREIARRYPDDVDVSLELTEIEALLGGGKRPLAKPPHSWLDSLRNHVEAAESAWARGATDAGNSAAERAAILADAAPLKIEDEALRHRLAKLRRRLAEAGGR